jgi:hypothetical protein
MRLLNNIEYNKDELIKKMYDDSFYYGFLGQHALSSSSCKHLLKGELDYHKSLTQTQQKIQAFRDGGLIHLAVLEPDKFNALHVVSGTKAGKSFKDAVVEYGYDNVFTSSEMEKAQRVSEKLFDCKDIANIINGCQKEIPAIANIGGVPFRGKADLLDGFTVLDLKTTADLRNFESSARNFNYDIQVAIYLELFDAIDFKFIAIDKKTLDIGFYEVSEDFINTGKAKLNKCITTFNNYRANKEEFSKINTKDLYVKGKL